MGKTPGVVREKKYFLSLSLEKESVKREMRIPTREIEILVVCQK